MHYRCKVTLLTLHKNGNMEDSCVALHDFYGLAYEDGAVGLAAGCLGWSEDYLCRLSGE